MVINTVFIIVTASLAIQLAVFVLLLVGYWFKRRQKYRQHGYTMATALVVHLSAIFVLMIPSFVRAVIPEFILVNPLKLISIVSLVHVVLGSIAASLGAIRVLSWRFQQNIVGCFNRKNYMRITMIIWLTTLILGISLYLLFNWQVLVG